MTSTDIRLKQELAQENKRLSEELETAGRFVDDWMAISAGFEATALALESTIETERAAHSHLVRQIEAEKDELYAHILEKLEEDSDALNRQIFWLTRD